MDAGLNSIKPPLTSSRRSVPAADGLGEEDLNVKSALIQLMSMRLEARVLGYIGGIPCYWPQPSGPRIGCLPCPRLPRAPSMPLRLPANLRARGLQVGRQCGVEIGSRNIQCLCSPSIHQDDAEGDLISIPAHIQAPPRLPQRPVAPARRARRGGGRVRVGDRTTAFSRSVVSFDKGGP